MHIPAVQSLRAAHEEYAGEGGTFGYVDYGGHMAQTDRKTSVDSTDLRDRAGVPLRSIRAGEIPCDLQCSPEGCAAAYTAEETFAECKIARGIERIIIGTGETTVRQGGFEDGGNDSLLHAFQSLKTMIESRFKKM